jgi:transposase InsO family protein
MRAACVTRCVPRASAVPTARLLAVVSLADLDRYCEEREGAYRFACPTSHHGSRALPSFLRWYNHRRPHGALGGSPPISRVSHVCGQHT